MTDAHYLCPVYGCEFTLPHETPTSWTAAPDESWAAAFERAIVDADTERSKVLREHAESHTAEDWMRTVTLLRQALGTAAPGHPLLELTAVGIVPSRSSRGGFRRV